MKKLNLFIALLSLIIVAGACNQKSKKTTVKEPVVKEKAAVVYSTVESIFQNGDSLSGKTVYVSGIIDHVCKHGGKRFKILSSDGKQELKIELGEKFEAANPEIAGKTAKVIGKLVPVQMDAKMVKAWEGRMKENHAGEEDTEHYKQELAEIQSIYKQIESGEISCYTTYSVQADKYELE